MTGTVGYDVENKYYSYQIKCIQGINGYCYREESKYDYLAGFTECSKKFLEIYEFRDLSKI